MQEDSGHDEKAHLPMASVCHSSSWTLERYVPASGFWKKDCTSLVMADHCSGVGDDIVSLVKCVGYVYRTFVLVEGCLYCKIDATTTIISCIMQQPTNNQKHRQQHGGLLRRYDTTIAP